MTNKETEVAGHKLTDHEIKIIRKRLLHWGRKNFKTFPWRRTKKLWHGLTAEVLLQRTRADTVTETYNEFIRRYKRPADLGNAPLRQIRALLYPLGLPARARYLKDLGAALAALNGIPPESLTELRHLPGIGPYAAAAYRSFHLRKRATIVDANVVRWICRLIGAQCDGETRRKRWLLFLADRLTPTHNFHDYNYAVLDFTLEICRTRPKCSICPIGPEYCAHGRQVLKSFTGPYNKRGQ